MRIDFARIDLVEIELMRIDLVGAPLLFAMGVNQDSCKLAIIRPSTEQRCALHPASKVGTSFNLCVHSVDTVFIEITS